MAVFGRPGPLPVLPVVLACAVGALLGLAARPAPPLEPPGCSLRKALWPGTPLGRPLPFRAKVSRFSVLVFCFARGEGGRGRQKKARLSNLRVWMPTSNWDPHQGGWFKIKQFQRPEISDSDTATCRGASQQVAGRKGSPRNCFTPGASLSAR